MEPNEHEIYTNAAGQFVFVGGLIDRITNLEKILSKQESRFDDAIVEVIHLEQQAQKSRELINELLDMNKALRDEVLQLKTDAEKLRIVKEAEDKQRQADHEQSDRDSRISGEP